MAKNKGFHKLNHPPKIEDLLLFVRAYYMLHPKEKDSATGNGDQPRTPEEDDAETSGMYYNEG
jgi:hypothetical protein